MPILYLTQPNKSFTQAVAGSTKIINKLAKINKLDLILNRSNGSLATHTKDNKNYLVEAYKGGFFNGVFYPSISLTFRKDSKKQLRLFQIETSN